QELRLAAFCRVFAVLYFAGALWFAAVPRLATHIAAVDPVGPPVWNILAVGLMAALGTACLVTAARPRERRHAILPVAAAQLATVALATAQLFSADRSLSLTAVV